MIGNAQAINKRRAGRQVSRKWLVLFVVLQVALWAGVVTWDPPATGGPLKVAVGLWPGLETLTIARERGILNGEKVRLIEMTWSSAAMRAFGNRVVDAAVLTLDETLRLRQNGHDVRVVLIMDVSAGADCLVAKEGIRETEVLRGRRVGVEVRTGGIYLLARALEREGLTVNDVNVIPLNLAETESALLDGEADAVVTSEPWLSRLLDAGLSKIFDSSMIPGELCRLLVVSGDALESRRDEVQGLVDAHFAVLGDMTHGLDSREREVIIRREQLSWDAFESARRSITTPTRIEGLRMMQGVPSHLDAMAERVADFMVRTELMPRRPDLSGWIDTSFAEGPP
jgi:NitT/TauT family transport system substrate-binding protein